MKICIYQKSIYSLCLISLSILSMSIHYACKVSDQSMGLREVDTGHIFSTNIRTEFRKKKLTIEQFFSQCVNVRKYEPKHALLKFCKKSKASDYYPPSRHSFVCNLFVFYLLKRIRAELYLQFFSLFFFCLSLFFWRSFALSLSHLSTEKFSGSSCHLKTVKGVKTVPLHHISLTLSYTSSRRMKLIHEHLLQSKIHLA